MTPRPDLLFALPGLVAEKIAKVLPELRQCEGISGPFDLEELKATPVRAPAVLVARLGGQQKPTWTGPHFGYRLAMAAYVVTRDVAGLHRDAACGAIVQAILGLLPDANWGQVGVGPAEDVQDRSLATRAVKQSGVALWAVTWVQPVTLVGWGVGTPLPVALYAAQAPLNGPDNPDGYTRIGGSP